MKTKLILSALLSFYFCGLSSQVPQGFNYQAIARDVSGNPIISTSLPVTITIQSDSLGGIIFWKELHSSVVTNGFGLFTLILGSGARQTASTVASFSDINWTVNPKFIMTEVFYQGTLKNMGSSRLWTVPYSMVAGELGGTLDKLQVAGKTTSLEEALFEVKNINGQTVFAVYNEGVRAYVDNGLAKGSKGGFAIGGFDQIKAEGQKYFFINSDSIRMYIDDNPLKKSKGGFAIGGFDQVKSGNTNFLNVATDASGIINPSQNRVLWYPIKNSFLAGRVLIEHPDSVGLNSFATGFESKAKGQYSQAMGYAAKARGDFSTAIGFNSVAKGESSYSFGSNAQAIGKGSFAFGSVGLDSTRLNSTGQTSATGEYAYAMGFGSKAIGNGSFAVGVINSAEGVFSLATGYGTVSKGPFSTTMGGGTLTETGGWFSSATGFLTKAGAWSSTAFGDKTYASGHTSFATGFTTIASGQLSATFGDQSKASGYASFAMGYNTTAQSYASLVLGRYNLISGTTNAWYAGEPIFVIGNGTSTTARSNAMTVYKNGNADFGGNGYFGGNVNVMGYGNFGGNGYFGGNCYFSGFGNYNSYINLNLTSTGRAIYVNNDEALWYNGTCFSWGYGGIYNFIAKKVAIGADVNSPTYMLYVTGSTYSSNGYASGSDLRWKKNLQPLENKINGLMQLNGYKFNWRKDEFPEMNFDSETQIGLIAQDVEKVFPELVRTDNNGFKAVSYEKLSVILLEGMKEQQKQIESLNEKISRLEKSVELLLVENAGK
jgi:hypothetical protein